MIVQAYVVLRDPAAAGQDKAAQEKAAQEKAAELQEFAKQSIAPYKYPRVVEFVPELPKTITGKTQRYRLRQLAEEKLRATPR
jgi:acyl-coenzyme A synthetase/AMP-(fatty) acid ligase